MEEISKTQQLPRAFSSTSEAQLYCVLIHRRAAHCISVVSVMDSVANAKGARGPVVNPHRGRHRDHM
jgi:hypothetical protein